MSFIDSEFKLRTQERENEYTQESFESATETQKISLKHFKSLFFTLRQERKMIEQFQGRMEDQHSQVIVHYSKICANLHIFHSHKAMLV